jgi:hypothetical protein
MVTHLFELFLMHLWNIVRRGVRPAGLPKLSSSDKPAADTVSLGTVVRSPLAPPPPPGAPTEVRLTTEEKRRHVYLLGSTGSGKTNLLLQLVRADIEQGRGVFLLDFRGELVDRVLMILASLYAPQELRDRLVLIDLRRDDYSVPFNPLREEAADPYTRVRFIMEVIKQQWDVGVQTEQLLRNSLLALSGGWSLYELEVLLTDRAFRARVLETVQDAAVRRFFARFDQMDNPSAWVEPVLNKVSPWLGRPVLRNMLAQMETVSFHERLEARPDSIVLVSLSADTLYGDAHLMGSLLTSALAAAAMRPDRRDRRGNEVCFYLDEFEHFDGLGEQFAAILSEGRKFGLCACLSHQASVQLSPKLRNLIRNVVGTQVFFSVGGGEADTLAGEIASDEPKALMRNLLMNQKIGECVVVRRGQPYTRIRTRHCPDPEIAPGRVEALRQAALESFGRPRARIEAELAGREAALANAGVPAASAPTTRPRPRKGRVRPPAPQDHTGNDTTDLPPETGANDIILEVRDNDERPTPGPPRNRRGKGSQGP